MLLRHLLLICPALAASLTVTPQHHRGPPLTPQLLSHRAAPPVLALPSTAALATASTIPTLLGFWKSEYGVSYAYGFAMAAAGAMHLSNPSPLAVAHAAVLLAYGFRLNLFLQACTHSTFTETMSIPTPNMTMQTVMRTNMISMAV